MDNGGWEIIGTDKSIQDALNYSVEYTKNYPNNLPPFFVGTPGAGKTHLSVSIITELILNIERNVFLNNSEICFQILKIFMLKMSLKNNMWINYVNLMF